MPTPEQRQAARDAKRKQHPGWGKLARPSRGAGWGGEAKGTAPRGERHTLAGAYPMTPEQRERARVARAEREERADLCEATVFDVMVSDETPMLGKLDAASRLHRMVRGEKQVVSATLDDVRSLTPEQLNERIAREEADIARLEGRVENEADPV